MDGEKKAKIHGVPGERARAAGVMRAVGPLLAALFACGLFTGLVLPRVGLGVAGAGFLVAAGWLVWAVRDGLKGIEAFFKGARGEERVAALLAGLPAGFHVFHDVACCGGAGGIDHVVVGPTGVFVIETKCWAGVVTFREGVVVVNGRLPSRPPLAQARASAHALVQFFSERVDTSPDCVPVVCFASDTFQPDTLSYEGAVICNAAALQVLITTHNGYLSADEIERAVKVMEQKD